MGHRLVFSCEEMVISDQLARRPLRLHIVLRIEASLTGRVISEQLAEKEKITIILSTHYMEEADTLCNRTAIIDHGKIIALDTPENLKSRLSASTIILHVWDVEKAKTIFPNAIKLGNRVIVPVKNVEREIGRIFRIAVKNQLEIFETSIHKPSLNDVFLYLTGRESREEKPDINNH